LRQIAGLAGFALFLVLALAVAALATWNVLDPSYSYATGNPPTNILGYTGAAFADIVMQAFGLSSVPGYAAVVAGALPLLLAGKSTACRPIWCVGARLHRCSRRRRMLSGPAYLADPERHRRGDRGHDPAFPALFVGAYPSGLFAIILGCIFAVPTAWLMLFAAGIISPTLPEDEDEIFEDVPSRARTVGDSDGRRRQRRRFPCLRRCHSHVVQRAGTPAPSLWHGSAQTARSCVRCAYDFNDDEFGTLNETRSLKDANHPR